MKNLVQRILSGIVYIILIYFGTTTTPWALCALMAFFFITTYVEFVGITAFSDKFYITLGLLASAFIYYLYAKDFLAEKDVFFLQSMSFAGPILFLIASFTILFHSNELYAEFSKLTIAIAYLAVPFSLSLTLPNITYELGEKVLTQEVLFIFILIWISDTFAYLIGKKLGKHKIFPKISPNKTWEGAIGGAFFTILFGYIIQHYLKLNLYGNWIVIAIIIAIAAPIGDVIESKLKRIFKAKDSGKLIPGHGGFLDRLDSFIFVIPLVYLYFLLTKTL